MQKNNQKKKQPADWRSVFSVCMASWHKADLGAVISSAATQINTMCGGTEDISSDTPSSSLGFSHTHQALCTAGHCTRNNYAGGLKWGVRAFCKASLPLLTELSARRGSKLHHRFMFIFIRCHFSCCKTFHYATVVQSAHNTGREITAEMPIKQNETNSKIKWTFFSSDR